MFAFDTRENIYPIDCNYRKDWEECEEKFRLKKNTYLTVVYLHMNNYYRVEKFYVQLTFKIDKA